MAFQLFNPAAVQTLAQQMASTGNRAGESQFERTLRNLNEANTNNFQAPLGLFLAQILNNGAQALRNNYEKRGDLKADILSGTPEQQKVWFEILQKTDPPLYERTKDAEKRAIDLSGVLPNAEQSNLNGINRDTTSAMAQTTTQQAREEIPTTPPPVKQSAQENSWDTNLNIGNGYDDRRQELAQIVANQSQTDEAAKLLGEPAQFNPEKIAIQREIIKQKQLYHEAEIEYKSALTEEQKVFANEKARRANFRANELRARLEGLGGDPSGFSEDTTIYDASKNLYSQKAKDFAKSMQGQYSKSSDQYYQEKYIEARVRGFNER